MVAATIVLSSQIAESFSPISAGIRTINTSNINDVQSNKSSLKNYSFPSQGKSSSSTLHMSENNQEAKQQSNLPMLLDPGTKGGALFLSLVLFIVPIAIYEFVTLGLGIDGLEAGKWIGVGFTFFTTVLWVGTYILRVATKDMTYAKQLKDYENAVIAKRLEELDEDEIQALVEDIERDDF